MNKKKIKNYLILIAILAIIGISGFYGIRYYLSKPKDPKPIIEEMVKIYYEKVLYPENKKTFTGNYEKRMNELEKEGILRTLSDVLNKVDHDDKYLLMNSKESGIKCNFFETTVNYTPISPYKEKDYKYDLKVSCKIQK